MQYLLKTRNVIISDLMEELWESYRSLLSLFYKEFLTGILLVMIIQTAVLFSSTFYAL
jgi:hypothetical protein